jgi:hypothetical protein
VLKGKILGEEPEVVNAVKVYQLDHNVKEMLETLKKAGTA